MKTVILLCALVGYAAAADNDGLTVRSAMRSLRSRSVGAAGDAPWKFEAMRLKMKAECRVFGTNETFDNVEATLVEAKTCLRQVVSSSVKPQKSKDLTLMVKQMCGVSPSLNQCVSRYGEAVSACTPAGERDSAATFIGTVFNFLCENGRLSSFLTDGGLACFRNRKDELLQCVNTSYPPEKEGDAVTTLSELDVCRRRVALRACIRQELEQCSRGSAVTFFDDLVKARGSSWDCHHLQAL